MMAVDTVGRTKVSKRTPCLRERKTNLLPRILPTDFRYFVVFEIGWRLSPADLFIRQGVNQLIKTTTSQALSHLNNLDSRGCSLERAKNFILLRAVFLSLYSTELSPVSAQQSEV